MRLPKILVLIICYLFRRRRGGRVAMSFGEIRMLRPAQPKPLSHQVTFLVRNFRFLWHRQMSLAQSCDNPGTCFYHRQSGWMPKERARGNAGTSVDTAG